MRASYISSLALASTSAVLCIAVLACSAHALAAINTSDTAWFLPIWRNHFDLRDIQLLIATSSVILVLNLAVIVMTVLSKSTIVFSSLGAAIALVAIIFPAALHNTKSPYTDTLTTWTCSWSASDLSSNDGPAQFTTLCTEARFAYYATIPIFILQLTMIVCTFWTPSSNKYGVGVEKSHSLDSDRRQGSWEADQKSVSPKVEPVQ